MIWLLACKILSSGLKQFSMKPGFPVSSSLQSLQSHKSFSDKLESEICLNSEECRNAESLFALLWKCILEKYVVEPKNHRSVRKCVRKYFKGCQIFKSPFYREMGSGRRIALCRLTGHCWLMPHLMGQDSLMLPPLQSLDLSIWKSLKRLSGQEDEVQRKELDFAGVWWWWFSVRSFWTEPA